MNYHTSIDTGSYSIVSEMDSAAKILLANGRECLVTPSDIGAVSPYSWYEHCGYARTTIDGAKVYMHRLIVGATKGDICDHLNGNRLDNRRENLRLVDLHGNARNRIGRYEYLGVFPSGRGWAARLIRGGKTYFLGTYDSPELAGYAVDVARLTTDGELPRPNTPDFTPTEDQAAEVAAAVAVAINPRVKIGPATIRKVVTSKLSDRYWAKRLGVRQNYIKAIRASGS